MSALPSKRDFLTNCYTREGLDALMTSMAQEYKTHGKPFSFLLIDIDHFKKYNDRYGHIHGDEALKYFSSTLRLYLQESECYPFRLGGDEFVVVFPRTTSQETANMAKKLERALKKRPFIYKDKMRFISFSGGIASYPTDGQTLEELLEASDRAMYSSKKQGRGRTTQYRSLPGLRTVKFLIFGAIALVALLILFGLWSMATDNHEFLDKLKAKFKGLEQKITAPLHALDIDKLKLPDQIEKIKSLFSELNKVNPVEIPQLPPEPFVTGSEVQPAETAPPVSPVEIQPEKPSEPQTTVYLTNGGKVTGTIVSEDDQEIRIKFQTQYGEGSTRVQKSLIKNIERP